MLILSEIAHAKGIYKTRDGMLMRRNRWLHPGAATSLNRANGELGGRVVFSGMLRSPTVSLWAAKQKRGVQPPGYSGHNFGLCVDIAVDATLDEAGISYSQLLDVMRRHGWHCHRRDGNRGFEDWHFNWLGEESEAVRYLAEALTRNPRTWAIPVEQRIQHIYGADLALGTEGAQVLLRALKLYDGEVDGISGPLTRMALNLFQRQWSLPITRALDPRTQRVLAVVGGWPTHIR